MSFEIRDRAEKELSELRRVRQCREPAWRDIQRHSRMHFDSEEDLLNDREVRRRRDSDLDGASVELLDPHMRSASRTLRSGLHGGMTSPARPWFKLGMDDPDLSDAPAVREWFSPIERSMRQVFRGSNVYSALQHWYGQSGDYGTTAGFVVPDFDNIIRAVPLQIGEYWAGADQRGIPNILYRMTSMTVEQLVLEFGASVSNTTQRLYDQGNYHDQVKVCRAVRPRRNRDPGKIDVENMPHMSLAWETEAPKHHMLRVSGVEDDTLNVSRWETAGYDAYGVVSPGLDALPDARQLQYYALKKAEAIDMALRPPVQGPASSHMSEKNFFPGGVSYVDDLTLQRGGFRNVFENGVRFDMNPMLADIAEQRRRVDHTYYVDLFLMFNQSDRREITAEEIIKRHEEKIIMLGPVLDLLARELLNPLIGRTFAAMNEAGLIPPPPQEIENKDIKVEYISLLAQAQKAVGVGAIERTIGFAAQAAQIIDPGARYRIDADAAIEEFSEMVGAPPKVIRSLDDAEALRAAEAEQQQQAEMMQAAPGLAGAASSLITAANDRGDQNLQASGVI